jgi:hypothetical protein
MQNLPEDTVSPKVPKWVWFSTRETIDNEVPSITAIVETILAVPLYWWIALKAGVFWPLAISVVVAPFVLLRSRDSIARGARWFSYWENKLAQDKRHYTALRSTEQIEIVALSGLSVLFFGFSFYFLEAYLLNGNSASYAPLLAFALGFGSITLAVAITAAIAVALVGARAAVPPGALAGVAGGIGGLLGATQVATPSVLLGTIIGLLLSLALSVGALRFLIYFPKYFGMGINVLIVSLVVRFIATARHLPAGIRAMPSNFRRLTICTSPKQVPELVPGLNRDDTAFSLEKKRDDFLIILKSSNIREQIIAILIHAPSMVLWFLPGWLYRLTLKSTTWFWWPLIFLGGNIDRAKNPEIFRWSIVGSLWAKASLIVALVSIIGFLLANLSWNTLFKPNPLLTPVGYLLRIEGQVWPWQAFAVIGSAMSVILVLLVDHVHGVLRIAKQQSNSELQKSAGEKLHWLDWLAWCRSIIVAIYLIMVAIQGILYFNSEQCWFLISPRLKRDLEAVYGDRLPYNDCDQRAQRTSSSS